MAISVIRFDLRAPAFSPASRRELFDAALEMAGFADERGFQVATLSEHHGVEDGYLPSPLVMAGVLAGRTRRIGLNVSALLVPLYDPVKLAEDLVVLDWASRGRLMVVAGLGYRPEEYAALGRDFGKRGKLLDEALDVLLRAWRGEAFDYRGPAYASLPSPSRSPTRRYSSAARRRRRRSAPRASAYRSRRRSTTRRSPRSTRPSARASA